MQQSIIKIARVGNTSSGRKLVAGSLELVQPIIKKILSWDMLIERDQASLSLSKGQKRSRREMEGKKKGRIVRAHDTTSVERGRSVLINDGAELSGEKRAHVSGSRLEELARKSAPVSRHMRIVCQEDRKNPSAAGHPRIFR